MNLRMLVVDGELQFIEFMALRELQHQACAGARRWRCAERRVAIGSDRGFEHVRRTAWQSYHAYVMASRALLDYASRLGKERCSEFY